MNRATSIPPPSSSREPERLAVLESDGEALVGLWRNVLVLAFRDQPTAEGLRRMGAVQRDVAARFPGGYAALAMLPMVRRPAMTRELREEAERLTSSSPPELRAVAEVIDGKGFLAATLRSVATSMVMLTRPAWPMRVFAGVEPAAAWLATWVDREARASAPRRLVEAIRGSLATPA
jgi:hypothetical protein